MQPRKTLTSVLCLLLGSCLALTGCSLAPAYTRPEAPVPTVWPDGLARPQPAAATGQEAADLPWQTFFGDPQLQGLIKLALEQNRSLRIAALNIERSQAQYQIKRAELVPKIDAL